MNLLYFLLCFSLCVVDAQLHDLYISVIGVDSSHCGPKSHPCHSLRTANANLNGLSNDTAVSFSFSAGTFSGNDNCNVPLARNATFRGASVGTTIDCSGGSFPLLQNADLDLTLQLLILRNTNTSITGEVLHYDLVQLVDSSVYVNNAQITFSSSSFSSHKNTSVAIDAIDGEVHLSNVQFDGYETAVRADNSLIYAMQTSVSNVARAFHGSSVTMQLNDVNITATRHEALVLVQSDVSCHAPLRVSQSKGIRLDKSTMAVGALLELRDCADPQNAVLRVAHQSALTVAPVASLRITNSSHPSQVGVAVTQRSRASLRNMVLSSINGAYALLIEHSDVNVSRSFIVDNLAAAVMANSSSVQFQKTVVANNIGALVGGLHLASDTNATLSDCRLFNNTFSLGGTAPAGGAAPAGAILVEDSLLELHGVALAQNGFTPGRCSGNRVLHRRCSLA